MTKPRACSGRSPGKGRTILRFSVLSSGSKGNALFVESDRACILIDNGLSLRELKMRMAAVERNVTDLDAVFLTHEHSDHIRGMKLLLNKHGIPVYATKGTFDGARRHHDPFEKAQCIAREDEVAVGDLRIESFPTPHDAAESVAYVVRCGSLKLGHATDLGSSTPTVEARLKGMDVLLIEANHDPDMLINGSYPWSLKKRVASETGHLSNQTCGEMLSVLNHDKLQKVVLMHLSEKNNRPELALNHAHRALAASPVPVEVARQDRPTPLFAIR
ncbi:MBL fold metallo-hydrolase [Nitrospina gracilis]|uniref:MBL fold metallo-hydrolase n=1 Tax=Nitrospina gracilis TaxID=35801 RepID=UPI001F1F6223|nr:phosphoribosyl 1,2-cyclic phosphodiesterase [Nitrospina gracilis Nb-211]